MGGVCKIKPFKGKADRRYRFLVQESCKHFEADLQEQDHWSQQAKNQVRKQTKPGVQAREIQKSRRKNNPCDSAAVRRSRLHGNIEKNQGSEESKTRKETNRKGGKIFGECKIKWE